RLPSRTASASAGTTPASSSSGTPSSDDDQLAVAVADGLTAPAAVHRLHGEPGRLQRIAQLGLGAEAERRVDCEEGAVGELVRRGEGDRAVVDRADAGPAFPGPRVWVA